MRLIVIIAFALSAFAANAAQASPEHYKLEARIDPAAATISARVRIDLPPEQVQAESRFILGARFKIVAADAGPDVSISTEATDKPFPGLQAVVIRTKPGKQPPSRIDIAWEGPLNPPKDSSPVVAASPERVELFVDSMWMPYRDDLGLVFTLDAAISGLPADMVVVSQGEIKRSGDIVTIRREIPDMDFVLVADKGLQRVTDGDVEIYARDLENPYVAVYRRHAAGSIDFYRKWFGPLPHRPVRLVVVSRAEGPGYARRGYIVVTERGAAKAPDERGIAGFIAHEFGHAWWNRGGPMTEDYWMTESMASYVSYRYLESIGKPLTPEERAALRDKSETTSAILGNGRPSGDAVYTRGPVLLADLEARIGRAAMDRIIGALARDPPEKTAGFLAKISEIAGPEAARHFEAELRRTPGKQGQAK